MEISVNDIENKSMLEYIKIYDNMDEYWVRISGLSFDEYLTIHQSIYLKHVYPKFYVCPLCGWRFKGRSSGFINHLIRTHEVNYTNEYIYFTFIGFNENKYCPYCGRLRKAIRPTRCYDTCGSKECKSLFSYKGVETQIKLAGSTANFQRKLIDARLDKNPDSFKECGRKGLMSFNKYKSKLGICDTEEEYILYNELIKIPNLNVVVRDYRFYHANGTPEFNGFNGIMDISLPDYKLDIEVDGESHFGIKDVSKKDMIYLDNIRELKLKELGWNIYRVPNWRIYTELDSVINEIKLKVGLK